MSTTLARSSERVRGVALQGPSIVQLDGVTKTFPVRRSWVQTVLHPRRVERTVVLDDFTCGVRPGEFFGLLGPNGAGKTTLFKILSTLVLPDRGEVVVAGHDVIRRPDAVRRVLAPVITEERSLMWRISARENLRLYATLQGLSGSERQRRIEELLEVVELTDAGERMVGKFSSGMKQRLLIARALLASPKVLLLDEPTRSLDPLSARRFRRFLREEISGRQGCTILLATHNAEEALELCDRVGVLDRGRLLALGTPEKLTRDYGDEKYRLWSRALPEQVRRSLAAGGVMYGRSWSADEEGWTIYEMELSGGDDRAAEVLTRLTDDRVPVARLERVPLSLADLIERILAAQGRG